MSNGIPRTIWLIGCGNMAGAMLSQWVTSGDVAADQVTVIDPGQPKIPEGVRHLSSPPEQGMPDCVMLGVKPQMLDDVAGSLAPRIKGVKLLLSILAGVDVAALADRFEAEAVVRVMPNLPVGLGKGVVALYGTDPDGEQGKAATALMDSLGLVEWIPEERLFDTVTALSGCGPGFVFRFIDAIAAAGAELGLPADQARRLATATVEGTSAMAAESDDTPGTLADRVASPGGSTREGMNVLDDDDALKKLMVKTLTASRDRNHELAEAARKK
ncbi:pyrroline-5-carboxylate reductase [Stakelama saccharophila]|uniref:Pyrroline-5-carboxylate reductase n=1 Tax=Stakelama saccharophila TaxID=3075605 RepID=A0ABZ0B724_9SPHN|nr:pyrroline-5-carboxylate reductase [Stakelama sp. W311]WNO53227.1 pyrroline-5-carboxylate reductase [Stakelama sp. W311]